MIASQCGRGTDGARAWENTNIDVRYATDTTGFVVEHTQWAETSHPLK